MRPPARYQGLKTSWAEVQKTSKAATRRFAASHRYSSKIHEMTSPVSPERAARPTPKTFIQQQSAEILDAYRVQSLDAKRLYFRRELAQKGNEDRQNTEPRLIRRKDRSAIWLARSHSAMFNWHEALSRDATRTWTDVINRRHGWRR